MTGVGRAAIAALGILVVAALPACVPLPPPGMPPTSPVSGARIDTTAARPSAAILDTTPSPEAVEVLASIPEPLRPEEKVAPPADTVEAPGMDAPPTPEVEAPDDTSEADVPVPSPTFPLGLEPPAAPDTTIDSTAFAPPVIESPPPPDTSAHVEPPPANPAPTKPAPTKPPSTKPAAADTCWRIQIGAPADRAKAQSLERAAQSLLLIPMVIEPEKRLFKVRTRDCWDRAASERIRERAIASGFAGTFRFPRKSP
jgi:hypothetical protein